ncbi:WD40 repeat domain-containing protein [Streptomyces europaeiscabiei]|uniref:hypothetical protein n=1 Tax=Streptomyces europaeiscabiei TaxID=146819 RepID=UPI0038D514CC
MIGTDLDPLPRADITVLRSRGNRGYINRVSWSPDGSRLAAACGLHGVRVWDIDRPGQSMRMTAHTRGVGQVAWSHSAERDLRCGDDPPGLRLAT